MKLTKSQQEVARWFSNGEFSHVTTVEEARTCGNSLFMYLIAESEDVEDYDELRMRVKSAIDSLNAVYLCIQHSE
jgi:hypothetical protein